MASITKRNGKWFAQVRRHGHSQSRTFTAKKDAETWTKQLELELERADLPVDHKCKLKGVTLAALVERYRDTVSVTKKGHDMERTVLNAFLRHELASKQVLHISTADFAAYRDERLREIKPVSLKRQLDILHNLFETARDEWKIPIKENPLDKLTLKATPVRRDRRLQDGELDLIIEEARQRRNPLMLPIVLFAIETGMRRSEILAMRWSHLDLKHRLLTIPETKNGHPRKIPLTKKALEVLEGLDPVTDAVFNISANAVKLTWQRILDKVGIEDLHFHDLRHECVSGLFEKGLNIAEAGLISGHRDWRSLKIYTNPKPMDIIRKLDAAAA